MAELPARKAALLGALIGASPDRVLDRLAVALERAPPDLAPVVSMIRDERDRRRRRRVALGPIDALFAAPRPAEYGPAFPPALRERLWRALEAERPDLMEALDDEHQAPGAASALCGTAAAHLRDGAEALGVDAEVAADLAAYFDLAGVLRDLPGRMTGVMARDEEAAPGFRLMLRDARAIHADGATRVLEVAAALSPEHSARVLRLVVQTSQNARDEGVLAGSELAVFVERLLEAADADAALARRLEPMKADLEGVVAGAAAICRAGERLAEVALTVDLRPGGAWSARRRAILQTLTDHAQEQMKLCEGAVDRALPLARETLAGSMTRRAPDLTADPDGEAVGLARRRLALLAGLRPSAAVLGCAALKAAVGETLAERLGDYAVEALDRLNDVEVPPADPDRAAALIGVAAEFLETIGDDGMATTVRRRLVNARERRAEGVSQDAA